MTETRLSDHQPNQAIAEGDDVPEPIRVFMYSDAIATIDGDLQISAYGPGALQTIARKLLAVGYDPDQELDVNRGGHCLCRSHLAAIKS